MINPSYQTVSDQLACVDSAIAILGGRIAVELARRDVAVCVAERRSPALSGPN
jgi:hypothetical protein